MALNIWGSKCVKCRAPCVGGFTKCVRLPSGVDIYEYGRTGRCAQGGERGTDYTYLFHHNSDAEVNRQIVIDELKKYRSDCVTCKCVIRRIRALLTELSQFNLGEVFAVCEHCEKLAEGIKCRRCQYIISKFKCSYLQMAERHRRLRIWIAKMKELQDLLDSQARYPVTVKKSQDLEDLRRILNEMYRPEALRATPRICEYDWAEVSLDEVYEHKEVLQRILEQMRDEGLTMGSLGMLGDATLGGANFGGANLGGANLGGANLGGANLGGANLGISVSHTVIRPPDNTPVTTIKTATSPTSDVAKMSEKTTSLKDPTQRLKTMQGTADPTQSKRAIKSTKGKAGKDDGKTGISSSKTQGRTEDSSRSPRTSMGGRSGKVRRKSISSDGKPVKCIPKYYIYEMSPVQSDDNWMDLNRNKVVIYYGTGEILAIFKQNYAVTWYYKNGMVALVYNGPKHSGEDEGSHLMYVVYSFEVDTRKKQSILAKFDYCGNGVVYDNQGNERLKYNQTAGKLIDRYGDPTTWLWHNLNEPPTYRKRFVDTYERNPDPALTKTIEQIEGKKSKLSKIDIKKESSRKTDVDTSERSEPAESDDESKANITLQQQAKAMMSRIEMENYAKKKATYETYTVRMKRIMINEFFSLKVIHQTQIYLMFHDGSTRFRLDLGLNINEDLVIRREYVFVSNEDYNICDHMAKSRESILEQEPRFEEEEVTV